MGDSDKKQVGGTHYVDAKITPWSVIDTWPLEQRVGAYRAGALKYLMRMGSKDERLQEIRKAGHYCEKLAEVLGAVPVEAAPEKPEHSGPAPEDAFPVAVGRCNSVQRCTYQHGPHANRCTWQYAPTNCRYWKGSAAVEVLDAVAISKLAPVKNPAAGATAPEKPEPAFKKPWYCNRPRVDEDAACIYERHGFCYEPNNSPFPQCVSRVDYLPGSKSPDLAKTQAAGLEQALQDQLTTGTGVLKTTRLTPDEFTTAPQATYGKCTSLEPCLSQIGVLANMCGAQGAAVHCRHWRPVPITPPAGPEQAHGAESEGGEA